MTTDPALLAERIGAVNEAPEAAVVESEFYAPNYNVAPTAAIATVVSRHTEPDDQPIRRVRLMRWGLVPPWAKAGPDGNPARSGPQPINARADKVTTSSMFRSSAQHKRCLIPMDGFYEWRVDPDPPAGRKGRKTPFYACRNDGKLLFMAGLWSVWRNPGNRSAQSTRPLLSCTIVTTDAVGELAAIHERMPLMLPESDRDAWLDPDAPPAAELLAHSPDVRGIVLREVSTLVNSVRNNGPELIEPAEAQPEQAMLL